MLYILKTSLLSFSLNTKKFLEIFLELFLGEFFLSELFLFFCLFILDSTNLFTFDDSVFNNSSSTSLIEHNLLFILINGNLLISLFLDLFNVYSKINKRS